MSVALCEQNSDLRAQIERFAEVLKTEAHRFGGHGLDKRNFITRPVPRRCGAGDANPTR